MSPDFHARSVELFEELLPLAPESRLELLIRACAGDRNLRCEVEAMLAADAQSDGLLETPPDDIAVEVLARQRISMVGQQLGEYEVTRLLAAGGMSEVYLARDKRLERSVALKILPQEYTLDSKWLHRFEQEARSVAALNHPNIVTIFGVGQSGSLHYLATEFVEGRTVREIISAGPVPPAMVADLAAQAASALASAHAQGIVHRDIKPENMIVRPDGLLKILDFGIAKKMQHAAGETDLRTIPGLLLGTPRYMSPEQLRGLEPDARSDVFSLGCVVYELLCGRPVAAGINAEEVLAQTLNGRHLPLTTLQPDCPLALVRTVDRTLERQREHRYATAAELLADLRIVQRELRTGKSTFIALHRRYGIAAIAAAMATVMIAAALWFRPSSTAEPLRSIAVLPFVNEGGADLDYVADGLTDSIIGNLSEVSNLKVTSRSSVFNYKGRQVDPILAGGMLKTRTVLLGRVSKQGDRISVRLELVDVNDGHRIWGEQYDRIMSDLVQTQSDIAREVLGELRFTLRGETARKLKRRQTANAEAYRLYLEGAYQFNHHTSESEIRAAIATFHRVLAEDPQYALAAAALANSYVALADFASPNDAMPKAREYAVKAIEMRGAVPEAHVALGLVKLLFDWDWQGAAREFKYDNSSTPSIDTFSCYLHSADALGRTQEAVATLTRLVARDPMSIWNNEELGCVTYYARQYDTSLHQSERAIEIQPDLIFPYINLARAYIQKGMYVEAATALDKGSHIDPNFPLLLGERAYVEAVRKNKRAATRTLDQLTVLAKKRYVDAYPIALVYLALGDEDKAFSALEQAYAQHSSSMPWLKVEPKFDPVRADLRYIDLLRRVGLTR